MGSAVSEGWYTEVVRACALADDFALFRDGDQSIPGSRGLSLSGGQKARLALARAVYSRTYLIVLDDVFSALDAKTEAHVVDSLFGKHGLLRKLNSTVVLATHSPRMMALVDRFIIMKADGTVHVNGLPTGARIGNLDADGMEEITSMPAQDSKTSTLPVKRQSPVKKPSANDHDDLTRRTGDVAVYRYHTSSISVLPFLSFISVTVVFAVASYFPQVWLRWWAESNGSHLAKCVSVYVILAVVAWISRAVALWCMLIYISPRSLAKLHLTMLKTAMSAPMSYFAQTDTGLILNRSSQDIGLTDRVLPLTFGKVLIQLCTILAQAALICQGSAFMAISIPFLLMAVYALQKIYLLTSRQLRFLELENHSPLYTNFLETLAGVPTIRALGWHEQFHRINIRRLDQSQRTYYLLFCIQRWLNMVLDLIVAAMAVIVIAFALRFSRSSSPRAIGIALNNILGFSQSLRVTIDAWTQLETALGAIARLRNLERTILPEHKPGETQDPRPDWLEHGTVVFTDVCASYNDTAQVLKGINISVKAGQKLGICGRTRSGTSSLLLTMLRFLELDSGTIFIDGVDIRTVPRDILRERFATVAQDPFIIADSVRMNIDPFGKTTGDSEIITTLPKVHLWSLIESRGGVDTHMKDQLLSQGQRQLFSLARAIVNRGSILVLDEATSNVDAESDKLMQQVIKEEFRGRTMISVAHRLDTILDSDVVVLLESGKVREMGRPADLLELPGSGFRELYERQRRE